MILIADSGSTKTDWILLDKDTVVKKINTIGLNPYFFTKEKVVEVLNNELIPSLIEYKNNIKTVYFYGAGCSNETNNGIINYALVNIFKNTKIFVEHDLLAAARALLLKNSGIACILGTGSNACLYDGNDITKTNLSLGYILGDEGGGVNISKNLLKKYLSNDLPDDLNKKFEVKFNYKKDEIVRKIYKESNPNTFIASFMPFVAENINDEFCLNLVLDSFDDFFKYQVSKLSSNKNIEIGCVGSIAHIFEKQFKIISEKWSYKVNCIYKTPIDGLIKFHNL